MILRMEERRKDLKDDSSPASAYDSSSRAECMSRKNDRLASNEYSNSDYEWITTDSATSSTVILSMEKRTKEVKDPIYVPPYTTAGSEGVQRLSPNEDRINPSAYNNSNLEYRHSSEDSITPGIVTSQLHQGFGNESYVAATTSSCNRSQDGGNKHVSVYQFYSKSYDNLTRRGCSSKLYAGFARPPFIHHRHADIPETVSSRFSGQIQFLYYLTYITVDICQMIFSFFTGDNFN